MSNFPLQIENGVYYLGHNSPKSYGGASYFFTHSKGNWMVDSPRFLPELTDWIEKQGGLSNIFLTHKDDVADSDQYAKKFSAKRWIHEEDKSAAPKAENIIKGVDVVEVETDLKIIPVPGHTKGHCVLLYKNKFLFTGDHLAWNPEGKKFAAWRDYCWYDWKEQKRSMQKLLDYKFEWVLPGHGRRVQLSAEKMRQELGVLIQRM